MGQLIDRIARIGLVVGVFTVMQPWWDQGLRVGFFITLLATIVHIASSHAASERDDLT